MEDEEQIKEQLEELEEEDLAEKMEQEREISDEISDDDPQGMGYPQPEEEFDKFKFLTEVKEAQDTVKTTLLTKGELGVPLFSVRFYLTQELKTRLKGYNIIGDYLRNKGIVTTDTGLSRDGFLMGLSL